MQKFIDLIIEDDSISLAQSLGNKKLQANCRLKCNESTNLPDEKTDNFKNDEITLLHVAAFYDSLECFCFLESKYKTKKNENILRTPSTKSYYPLHYACFNGSREIVAYILSQDPEEASMILPNIDHHFLFYTVYGGDPIILTELFKNGADLQEAHNKADDPIGKAISLSQIECLKVLLKYEKGSSNSNKYTPAMLASKNCHPEALKLLISSEEDITYSSGSNESVISLMFHYSNGLIFKDVLLYLLRRYPNARIEPPSDNIAGVVHWICKIADKEISLLMIQTADVNINRLDENNYSGPHYMAIQKNIKEDTIIDILRILINNNFDVNLKPKNIANAPRPIEYFLNAMVRRTKVIQFLLENGARLDKKSSKDPNKTIYEQAMNTQNQEMKNLLSSYYSK